MSTTSKRETKPANSQCLLDVTTPFDPWTENKPRIKLLYDDFSAAKEDVVSTIDHPVVGIVKNVVSLSKGTNPIVKMENDFPKISLLLGITAFIFALLGFLSK